MGSSNYITNLAGQITQSMVYMPFGELLADEHLNSYNTPFKFNAKEHDAESGLFYYGARYYDPKWSMWLSVDPLAEEAPDWTPYRYGFHNPLKFTDPTGMSEEDGIYIDTDGNKIGEDALGASDGRVYVVDGKDKNKVTQATANGQTIETSELTNYAELPSNAIKQKEKKHIQDGVADPSREYSYARIEYPDGKQPYDHYDKGDPYVPGEYRVSVHPTKNIPRAVRPGGVLKHVGHVHNLIDPTGNNQMKGTPSPNDKKFVRNNPNSTHAVHDTRENTTYVMRATGATGWFSKKVVQIKMPTTVYQRENY